jgi:MarC family membrane protein
MNTEFLSAVVLLLLVTDPFGNVPLVPALVAGCDPKRRTWVIVRECMIAYAILLAFMFGGHGFLQVMHLSEAALSIAGGVILFLIAIRMVFGHPEGLFGGDAAQGEPFIVPLAVPFIAGPSALATVMLMATREPGKIGMWAAAITVVMAIVTAILVAAERIRAILGEKAVVAIERLMGLILTAIAVEMLLGGIRAFVSGLKN